MCRSVARIRDSKNDVPERSVFVRQRLTRKWLEASVFSSSLCPVLLPILVAAP
jgi:hypothetical protein